MIITILTLLACNDKDIDTTDTSVVIDTGTSNITDDTGTTNSVETGDTQEPPTDTETDDTDTGIDTSDTDTDTDTSTDTNDTSDTGPACTEYNSPEEEFAPIQITAVGIPQRYLFSLVDHTVRPTPTQSLLLALQALPPLMKDSTMCTVMQTSEWFLSTHLVLERWFMCVPAAHNRPSLHSTMTCESAAVAGATTSW